MLILLPGIPLFGLFLSSGSVLIGKGHNEARAALDLISSILLLVATVLVVDSTCEVVVMHSRTWDIWARGLVAAAVATLFVRPRFHGIQRGLATTLRASMPLGQFDLFAIAYARADSVMLFLIPR